MMLFSLLTFNQMYSLLELSIIQNSVQCEQWTLLVLYTGHFCGIKLKMNAHGWNIMMNFQSSNRKMIPSIFLLFCKFPEFFCFFLFFLDFSCFFLFFLSFSYFSSIFSIFSIFPFGFNFPHFLFVQKMFEFKMKFVALKFVEKNWLAQ